MSRQSTRPVTTDTHAPVQWTRRPATVLAALLADVREVARARGVSEDEALDYVVATGLHRLEALRAHAVKRARRTRAS